MTKSKLARSLSKSLPVGSDPKHFTAVEKRSLPVAGKKNKFVVGSFQTVSSRDRAPETHINNADCSFGS